MDSSRQVKKESTERVEFVGIQHAGLLVENTEKARDFYVRVLGMKDVSSERPNLPYNGAFIQVGTQQIHLMQLPSVDPKEGRPTHGGRDRHVAFGVSNLDRLVSRLEQYGHAYTFSKSGRRAIFCRDVDDSLGGVNNIYRSYTDALRRRPISIKSATSFVLFSLSDLICQLATENKLEWRRLVRFAVWGNHKTICFQDVLNKVFKLGSFFATPLLHLWHLLLELLHPSSSVWRALCSVLFDQCFMTPLYTVLFFIYDAAASGKSLRMGFQRAKTSSASVIWKTWIFWYPAQFINLRWIPVDVRVLYISLVSIGWNVYFSSVTKQQATVVSKDKQPDKELQQVSSV
eukprot:jgi/Galph1/4317/GphlegSOOS_G3016.1